MSSIVIAEKPSQKRLYERTVGQSYGQVFAARGHLFELEDPGKLNPAWSTWSDVLLKPASGFYPTVLKDDADARQRYSAIRSAAKSASTIYLATDPDREGEGIAQDILNQLKRDIGFSGRVMRVLPLGEDQVSVEKAFAGARPIEEYKTVYHAFQARAQSDHIFNLSLTRAATTLFRGGSSGVVSIGRVVTPTLGIVCEREVAIADFKPEDYFVPVVVVSGAAGSVKLALPSAAETRIFDRAEAERLAGEAARYHGPIAVKVTSKKQAPPRLFSMSSLQVETSKRWKWSAKKTAETLQKLYSDYQVTTYPRSSEVSLPEAEIANAGVMKAGIEKIFGAAGYDSVIRKAKGYFCDADLKGASHFAIVPNINTVEQWPAAFGRMGGDEKRLFELIARRYLAALGPDRLYDSTLMSITAADREFRATGTIERDPGWKRAWGASEAVEEGDQDEQDAGRLPPFRDGDRVAATSADVEAKQTTPPARLSEGALIELMLNAWKLVHDEAEAARLKEAKGIGTDATREGIVFNLIQRGFVRAEGGKLYATEIGLQLYRLLLGGVPALLDVAQTARMELQLDQVQRGDVGARATVETIIGQAGDAIAAMRRVGATAEKLDLASARLPTAKMLAAARSKAKREGKRLPKGVAQSFDACRDYLGPMSNDRKGAPSARQVAFAERIATAADVPIPTEARDDARLLSSWIDEHKSALPARSGGSKAGRGKVRGDRGDNRTSGGQVAPSDKQMRYAERVANLKGLVIPSDCLVSGRAMSQWLDQHG